MLNPIVSDPTVLTVTSKRLLEKTNVAWYSTSFLLISNPPSLLPCYSSHLWCAGSETQEAGGINVFSVLLCRLLCHHTLHSCLWNVFHPSETSCHLLFKEWISRYSLGCKSSKLAFRFHKLDLGYFDSMNLDL